VLERWGEPDFPSSTGVIGKTGPAGKWASLCCLAEPASTTTAARGFLPESPTIPRPEIGGTCIKIAGGPVARSPGSRGQIAPVKMQRRSR
jgi:hypothetical protein